MKKKSKETKEKLFLIQETKSKCSSQSQSHTWESGLKQGVTVPYMTLYLTNWTRPLVCIKRSEWLIVSSFVPKKLWELDFAECSPHLWCQPLNIGLMFRPTDFKPLHSIRYFSIVTILADNEGIKLSFPRWTIHFLFYTLRAGFPLGEGSLANSHHQIQCVGWLDSCHCFTLSKGGVIFASLVRVL